MNSLFIGRFQPFHNGHLHDVKEASRNSNKVIIIIGSSQKSNTPENPFSFDERKEMIENTLQAEKISNYEIIPIPDVNDDEKWFNLVKNKIPAFNIVYTGNNLVKNIFQSKQHKVKDIDMIDGINATEIRERISNHQDWKNKVPPAILEYLKKIDGENRIKNIHGNNKSY